LLKQQSLLFSSKPENTRGRNRKWIIINCLGSLSW
jgi:hypothetical protein